MRILYPLLPAYYAASWYCSSAKTWKQERTDLIWEFISWICAILSQNTEDVRVGAATTTLQLTDVVLMLVNSQCLVSTSVRVGLVKPENFFFFFSTFADEMTGNPGCGCPAPLVLHLASSITPQIHAHIPSYSMAFKICKTNLLIFNKSLWINLNVVKVIK